VLPHFVPAFRPCWRITKRQRCAGCLSMSSSCSPIGIPSMFPPVWKSLAPLPIELPICNLISDNNEVSDLSKDRLPFPQSSPTVELPIARKQDDRLQEMRYTALEKVGQAPMSRPRCLGPDVEIP
jgi:hypothetical protein